MRALDAEWPDVNRDARLHCRCALAKVLASNSLLTLATNTSGIQEIPEMTSLTLPLPPSLPFFRVLAVWGLVNRHVCRLRRGGRCGRHSGRDAGGPGVPAQGGIGSVGACASVLRGPDPPGERRHHSSHRGRAARSPAEHSGQ